MGLIPCAAIITDKISDSTAVELIKRLDKFTELYVLEVSSIPIATDSLIRWIHVDEVGRSSLVDNVPIVH